MIETTATSLPKLGYFLVYQFQGLKQNIDPIELKSEDFYEEALSLALARVRSELSQPSHKLPAVVVAYKIIAKVSEPYKPKGAAKEAELIVLPFCYFGNVVDDLVCGETVIEGPYGLSFALAPGETARSVKTGELIYTAPVSNSLPVDPDSHRVSSRPGC